MSFAANWLACLLIAIAVLGAGCVSSGAGVAQIKDETVEYQGRPVSAKDFPAHVSGVVIDTELLPIGEVDVVVTPGDHHVLTDAAGTFLVGPLEPGNYVVSVGKRGYASKEQAVTVSETDEAKIRLTLEAIASDVPHHETFTEAMYLICHVVLPNPATLAQTYILNAPCAGIVDLFAGTVNSLDHWMFSFTIDKPGFQSLLMEMTWQPQQFGHDGLMQLTTLGKAEVAPSGGVGVGGTVYGGQQGPPFHMVIHAGINYWNANNPDATFYPVANETEHFQMLIAGGSDNNTVPNTAFFLEFRPTAYLTFFYNRQASNDFSILPEDQRKSGG